MVTVAQKFTIRHVASNACRANKARTVHSLTSKPPRRPLQVKGTRAAATEFHRADDRQNDDPADKEDRPTRVETQLGFVWSVLPRIARVMP